VTAAFGELLVGTWALDTYIIESPAGELLEAPFGPAPQGSLLYTAEGHVAVHASAPDRAASGTERPIESTTQSKVEAYDSYFGYCGTYVVEGDRVTHHVAISCFPDWTGTELRRSVSLDGEKLVLRGCDPAARIPVLTWHRDRGPAACMPR
jgi:hypothetical protein